MIVRAEMRMADEIDKGQERGEVANKGQRANVRAADISELDDLGVSRQRLSEWRKTRDAGMVVVGGAIAEALDEGRAPTKADIRRATAQAWPSGCPSRGTSSVLVCLRGYAQFVDTEDRIIGL